MNKNEFIEKVKSTPGQIRLVFADGCIMMRVGDYKRAYLTAADAASDLVAAVASDLDIADWTGHDRDLDLYQDIAGYQVWGKQDILALLSGAKLEGRTVRAEDFARTLKYAFQAPSR